MIKTISKISITFALLFSLASAVAEDEHKVLQQDKAFSTESLTIKVGDSVKFENADDFFHNVYSLSSLKSFDLGSYPAGEARSVKFEEAGEVEVECAIHPSMYMTIKVEE
ncbi:MAG: plastocyanin/azurin family copper-binding protein [Gammaproteobacteria bacterium]